MSKVKMPALPKSHIRVMMSSRRTIMDGEVVTFATDFEPRDSVFGEVYDAQGPFDVSASRDGVMVHRARCSTPDESEALIEAIRQAESIRAALEPHWRGGHPSMYPSEPTPCTIRALEVEQP